MEENWSDLVKITVLASDPLKYFFDFGKKKFYRFNFFFVIYILNLDLLFRASKGNFDNCHHLFSPILRIKPKTARRAYIPIAQYLGGGLFKIKGRGKCFFKKIYIPLIQ